MSGKIAMISEHASPLASLGSVDSGGQNVYVAQIARNLARMGYRVDIFTRRDDARLPEIYPWVKGVRVIHVPAGPARFVPKEKLLPYMKTFSKYIQNFMKRSERPYSLVHAHFWMSAIVAMEIKEKLGIPFVVTFHALGRVRRLHQGENDEFPDSRFDFEEQAADQADRIIAECPQDEQDLINHYNANPEKIRIIPCGFDPSEMMPLDKVIARRNLGIPKNEFVVLQLGRMVPRKGVDNVVLAFSQFLNKNQGQGRLLIVGGESEDPDPMKTPEIARLKKLAEGEGIVDKVEFLGRKSRSELKNFYSAADVFLSTPWYEPFGITPVEAMACGTPVIGSKVGGIKYTVLDGETGFLVSPSNPKQLAKRLSEMYQNPELLRQFGENAVQRANELFTWQKVTAQIADLYDEVAAVSGEKAAPPAVISSMGLALKAGSNGSLKSKVELTIDQAFSSAIETMQRSRSTITAPLIQAAEAVTNALLRGNKVMVCGNGGSAADAQHFAAEFVGRFLVPGRRALPVISLNTDTAFLTAWSNDAGFEQIFSRQVEAFGNTGDVLIAISTSGRSPNLLEAFSTARKMDIECIALLGGDGGELIKAADIALVVPSTNTPRIQEAQLFLLHMLCELTEGRIAAEVKTSTQVAIPGIAEKKKKNGWRTKPQGPIQIT
jgi:D-inositol-3-phosphate glycosyltransferase